MLNGAALQTAPQQCGETHTAGLAVVGALAAALFILLLALIAGLIVMRKRHNKQLDMTTSRITGATTTTVGADTGTRGIHETSPIRRCSATVLNRNAHQRNKAEEPHSCLNSFAEHLKAGQRERGGRGARQAFHAHALRVVLLLSMSVFTAGL